MNKEFSKRVEEYLSSECSDYDLTYQWEWIEDIECCVATIKRNDHTQFTKSVNFRYNETDDILEIELSEDSFYPTCEYDYTVKYFWMLIAPTLFPDI